MFDLLLGVLGAVSGAAGLRPDHGSDREGRGQDSAQVLVVDVCLRMTAMRKETKEGNWPGIGD